LTLLDGQMLHLGFSDPPVWLLSPAAARVGRVKFRHLEQPGGVVVQFLSSGLVHLCVGGIDPPLVLGGCPDFCSLGAFRLSSLNVTQCISQVLAGGSRLRVDLSSPNVRESKDVLDLCARPLLLDAATHQVGCCLCLGVIGLP
jgi:hypothetical protein